MNQQIKCLIPPFHHYETYSIIACSLARSTLENRDSFPVQVNEALNHPINLNSSFLLNRHSKELERNVFVYKEETKKRPASFVNLKMVFNSEHIDYYQINEPFPFMKCLENFGLNGCEFQLNTPIWSFE